MKQIGEWIVKNKKEILLIVIFFLIIALSFGLGFIVARDYSKSPIIIEKYQCK